MRILLVPILLVLANCGESQTPTNNQIVGVLPPVPPRPVEDPAVVQCRAEIRSYQVSLSEFEAAESTRRMRCDNLSLRQDEIDADFRNLEMDFPISAPLLASCARGQDAGAILACAAAVCLARKAFTGVNCEDVGDRLGELVQRQNSIDEALSSGCCTEVSRGRFAQTLGRYRSGGSCTRRTRPERPYCSLTDAEKAARDAATQNTTYYPDSDVDTGNTAGM